MNLETMEKEEARTAAANAARHLLVKQTDCVYTQLIRFGLVGALATVVDTSLLCTLAKMHVYHPLAIAAGFVAGTIISYLLSVRWVFASRNVTSRAAEFAAFGAVGFVGFLLNEWIILSLVHHYGDHFLFWAKMVSVVTVFAWNFGARKYLMFRSSTTAGE